MKKFIKVAFFAITGIALIALVAGGLFAWKAMYGFNFYDTDPPELPVLGEQSVLVFSKTNAFRHKEAIEASQPAFRELASDNGWYMYHTENGAIFNPEQLPKFDVVIWNNVSGKALNSEQRYHFRNWLKDGGGFVGIHAAGDFSHQWDWYEDEVIGARFSHHTMRPQFQEGTLSIEINEKNLQISQGLAETWIREEEWYVFYENPRERSFTVLYRLDGAEINPDGSIPVLAPDKDFGMGSDHPVAWYRELEEGRIFYTSMGHQAAAFSDDHFLRMIENAVRWTGRYYDESNQI
jgi:uncharacterized protein